MQLRVLKDFALKARRFKPRRKVLLHQESSKKQ